MKAAFTVRKTSYGGYKAVFKSNGRCVAYLPAKTMITAFKRGCEHAKKVVMQ